MHADEHTIYLSEDEAWLGVAMHRQDIVRAAPWQCYAAAQEELSRAQGPILAQAAGRGRSARLDGEADRGGDR